MNQMIAFCGLDCARCEAYLATQANDEAAKGRIAAKWRQEYNAPEITVADVTCDGCTASNGRLGGYCPHCEIRACGVTRGLANCAHCADYSACEKLDGFFKMAPDARVTLEGIRRAL